MAPVAAPPDRRVDCSVLWAALTAYAEADVRTQVDQREALHRAAARALDGVPPEDRIVLETDLGLAVCFLGGPPVAARAASALLAPPGDGAAPPLALGLSHGPVAVLSESDSVPRLIGDGVVVAERMAGFAAAGQILASRAFTDTVASGRVRDRAFRALGTRTDAQLRAHEVFELLPEGAAALSAHAAAPTARTALELRRAGPLAAVAAVVAVAGLVAALLAPGKAPPVPVASQVVAKAPAVIPPPATAPVAPPAQDPSPGNAETPEAPARTIAEPDPAAAGAQPRPERTTARPAAAEPARPPGPRTERARTPAGPPGKAIIGLAVSPWGEVFVNGKRAGVSPPLTSIDVAAGRVTVELRNGDAPPYRETMQLAPGEEVRVRHRF
mgnify:CR=1 FL=1